ncbi:MAG TPA: aldose 1-epimerase family protein [Candidatus Hydrogenedentes bacterium]|nr:aldose 1-epimerase family protein [Candidatus Hydrogenedentota bacterium]HIJ73718.1 aldose 1-epimerase family protein [Candidatus Hydrogenedentota bacterium]
MEIYGKKYAVKELRRRVGNMGQIAGVRTVQLDDGNERPARAAIIHTGSGLELTLLLDKCLDIASASFCGKAMGWRSSTGDVAPQYYEAEWLRWLRSFQGGLVGTCGLMNVGAPDEESGLLGTGLHGRIGNAPARDIKITQEWHGNSYVLSVSGLMRETVVFGENLTLAREVSTTLGERRFWIHDVVTNEGFNNAKFQLLYHINIGWPAVDAGSEMIMPSRCVAPRDPQAEDGKRDHHKIDPPTHKYAEKVYYHDMATARNGDVTVAIVNDGFDHGGEGFGVYAKYNKNELPRFAEWKQMGEQDYVVGFEPCNCSVEGRGVDRKLGLLHTIRAGESKHFHLEFGPITDVRQVRALRAARRKIKTKYVDHYTEFVKKP